MFDNEIIFDTQYISLYFPQYRVRIKRSPNSKKVKSAKSEIRIKRIWGAKVRMPKSELNEVRIKREQSVCAFGHHCSK